MQSKGVVHGDIQPDNIMIDKNFVPKLVDFGSACVIEDIRNPMCPGFGGLPQFTAPELYMSRIQTFSSDIWSLAMILYYEASGKYPYNYNDKMHPNGVRDYLIAEVRKGIEPEKLNTSNNLLNEIVNKALVIDKDKRITANEIDKLLTFQM